MIILLYDFYLLSNAMRSQQLEALLSHHLKSTLNHIILYAIKLYIYFPENPFK